MKDMQWFMGMVHRKPVKFGIKPRPFPGAYPTRWWLRIAYGEKRKPDTLNYFGKPNKAIAGKIAWLTSHLNCYFFLVEFDQGGVIQIIDQATPNPDGIRAKYWHPDLVRFYYPFAYGANLLDTWQKGQNSLRFRAEIANKKAREFVVYAPSTYTPHKHFQAFEAQRQWLKATNIELR